MKASFRITAENARQQRMINEHLKTIQQEFSEAQITVSPESKKIVPEEIVLLIAIQVTAEVLLKVLDKVWKYLLKEDVKVDLASSDEARDRAEVFLKDKQILDFKIIKMEDRGLYVFLMYQARDGIHQFYISKSDLEIIKYIQKAL